MGKNTKRVKEFIESIPDEKLATFPTNPGTIFTDSDFRLDMQGMTTPVPIDPKRPNGPKKPRNHNLQIQINKQTTITSLKKSAPQTVALLLVSEDDTPSADDIRAGLITDRLRMESKDGENIMKMS